MAEFGITVLFPQAYYDFKLVSFVSIIPNICYEKFLSLDFFIRVLMTYECSIRIFQQEMTVLLEYISASLITNALNTGLLCWHHAQCFGLPIMPQIMLASLTQACYCYIGVKYFNIGFLCRMLHKFVFIIE